MPCVIFQLMLYIIPFNALCLFHCVYIPFYAYVILFNALTDEGVYMDGNGRMAKEMRLQWGETPTSVGESHDAHTYNQVYFD